MKLKSASLPLSVLILVAPVKEIIFPFGIPQVGEIATVREDFAECSLKAEGKFLLAEILDDCNTGEERGADIYGLFIISPRETNLLNEKPTIRWNPIPGIDSYTIQVEDGLGDLWMQPTEVIGTEVLYEGKPLKRGEQYYAVVTTGTGESSEVTFKLLNADNAHEVQTLAIQIQQQLSGEVADLALAHLYIAYGLRAEAIALLEPWVERNSPTLAVYRLLGDLYDKIGLPLLAKDRYLTAFNLAKAAGDALSVATAQRRLGEIYRQLGDELESIRWLTQALDTYQVLGEMDRVEEIENQLQKLNQ